MSVSSRLNALSYWEAARCGRDFATAMPWGREDASSNKFGCCSQRMTLVHRRHRIVALGPTRSLPCVRC